MSMYIIHILLLDGKILCIDQRDLTIKILIKHLCHYLNLQRPSTVGLLYKDLRGSLQWLDESKFILDHDIATDNEIIMLMFKIRHVPHHICYNESNIHQLFLMSSKLLERQWFISQIEIHSQLVALYILFKFGSELRTESEIDEAINQCNLIKHDPLSNEDLLTTITNAYMRYRAKFSSMADYLLKFLQLTIRFPVFNSRLFVVTDSKGKKLVLGVSSLDITLFHLDQFHTPLMKYKFPEIENVMHRGIKIIIDLKYQKSNTDTVPLIYRSSQKLYFQNLSDHHVQRETRERDYFDQRKTKRSLTPSQFNLENEMITFYALSPHQSECIYSEIQDSRTQFRESASSLYKIADLMKNNNFVKCLNQWLLNRYFNDTMKDYEDSYRKGDVEMFLEQDVCDGDEANKIYFGETNMMDSDIYDKLYKESELSKTVDKTPDYDQLFSEEKKIKELLKEKMIQLHELFLWEEIETGIMPKKYFQYFPNGVQKFQRNMKNSAINYHQLRGCAASVRNRFLALDTTESHHGSHKYQSKTSFSASSNRLSPSYTKNLVSSHSVTDLRYLKNEASPKSKSRSNCSIRSYDDKKMRLHVK